MGGCGGLGERGGKGFRTENMADIGADFYKML